MSTQKLFIPLESFEREKTTDLILEGAKIFVAKKIQFTPDIEYFLSRLQYIKYYLQINLRRGEKSRRTLDRAIIIFKLFKDAFITSQFVLKKQNDIYIIDDFIPHYIPWNINDLEIHKYCLKSDEESKFCDFWKEYRVIDYSNFAVNRFHLADYRPYQQDRFIDYVLALEHLFVPEQGSGEISYKLRSRACIILGDKQPPDKKEVIYNFLKSL